MLLSIHDLKIYGYFEKVVAKVHEAIPKGDVGGFEFTVLQISLKNDTRGQGRTFASAKGKQKT